MSRARAWQVADGLWGALFLYALAVNLNDPDPMPWVVFYGTGVMACAMHGMGRLGRRSAWLLAVLYAGWAALTASQGIEQSHPMSGFPQYGVLREEVVRESLGLALVGLWCAVMGIERVQQLPVTEPSA